MMEERPIDKGWAWMICLGVGINSMFLSGPLRSYGVLFVEISERFEASGSISSIMFTMISIGMAITSPAAATLGERYSQRKVIIVGGLLNFTGAFLTAFAPNVEYICVIFGIFTGLGLGCMFAPAVVMIGYYFDKRRSLANGLGFAGGSIGQMTIPILFTYLLDTYSFQGGVLIFSALLLHIVVGGMLLRPISCYRPISAESTKECSPKVTSDKNNAYVISEKIVESEENLVQIKEPFPVQTFNLDNKKFKGKNDLEVSQYSMSLDNLHVSGDCKKGHEYISNRVPQRDLALSLPFLNKGNRNENLQTDISSKGSFYLLPYQPQSPEDITQEKEIVTSTTDPDVKFPKSKSCFLYCFNLYDWKLFKEPIWMLYALSIFFGNSGYMTMSLFLPAFAREKNIDKYYVSLLISIAGAATLFGRIGGGAFGDMGFMKKYILTSCCYIIIGTSAFILPFVPYYPCMCIFAAILGFVGGIFIAQIVSVVIELMGIDKISSGFGLALMVSGLMQIPVPIILGLLKDVVGTYDWSMYLCGVSLILGAACLMIAGKKVDRDKSRTS